MFANSEKKGTLWRKLTLLKINENRPEKNITTSQGTTEKPKDLKPQQSLEGDM